jgi:hypothetical protein
MAILTTSGRTAMAQAVAAQPLHLAWGSGDAAWDAQPGGKVPETIARTALLAEVGRRGGPALQYVISDVAGAISLPSGRWTVVNYPTNNLYMRFAYDFEDGATSLIRELGIFVGTVIKPAVLTATPGKLYFTPTEILTPGTLLALQHVSKVTRSAETRQAYEFVLVL